MKEFTESLWFIILFLVGTLLLRTFGTESWSVRFLLIVLTGMILTNADKFSGMLNQVVTKGGKT